MKGSMMQRTLAIIHGGEQEANLRVDALKKQFGDHDFKIQPHGRKHEIVVTSTEIDTPTLETMSRVAQGHGVTEQPPVQQAPIPKTGGAPKPLATPATSFKP
jgi:hypothetical protein